MPVPCPRPRRSLAVAVVLLAGAASRAAEPAGVGEALKAIRSVSREGAGNEAAAAAWKRVVAAGPDALIPTLAAFDGASPAAANWLRGAVDAIAEGQRKVKKPLPAAELERFVKDTKGNPAARRIAYELFAEESKDAAAKLLGSLLDDPSADLRRDAIAARLKTVPAGDAGKADLQTLFAASRDKDQVDEIAKRLEALGEKPDLVHHFGFVTEWLVVGPFDSPDGTGFAKSFPPETNTDPAAKFEGKGGASLTWKYAQATAPDAEVDLNAALGKHKDAVAYAVAVLEVGKETPAEVRVSSPNATAIFVNGKKLFEREEYHHGASFDQYVGKCVLKPGRNEVLLKLVQDDEKPEYAQVWQFVARVCDPTGGRLPLKQHIVKDGKPTTVTPGAVKPAAKKKEDK